MATTTARRQLPALALFAGACALASLLGGLATSSSVGGWYQELAKPSWTPPGWVFGPVWTALYAAMAVAAWLVWRARPASPAPLTLFFAQLGLNVLWSVLFFGLRNPGAAAVEIVVLLAAIVATTLAFARYSRLAAALMTPYALWVGFAGVLNFAVWRMNG